MRYGTWGKVSVDLARLAVTCGGNEQKLQERLAQTMRVVGMAIEAKRCLVERLFHAGGPGPLGFLNVRKDGEAYLRRTTFTVGIHNVGVAAQVFSPRAVAGEAGVPTYASAALMYGIASRSISSMRSMEKAGRSCCRTARRST